MGPEGLIPEIDSWGVRKSNGSIWRSAQSANLDGALQGVFGFAGTFSVESEPGWRLGFTTYPGMLTSLSLKC